MNRPRNTLGEHFAKMLKGGVIMDVMSVEQAQIAEEAGAVAVMALGRPDYLGRSEQRQRTQDQQATSQRRREQIRKAHTACKALGVGEREECLRKAQKSLK